MPIKLVELEPKEQECRREEGNMGGAVCVLGGRGGFRSASLPGSLLGLHSLKLVFYKGPCLAERGKPARVKRKGWASPVKDATVAMWGKNTVLGALVSLSSIWFKLSECYQWQISQ